MGQQEIIDCLEKEKCPLTAKEIAEKISSTAVKVSICLETMTRYNEVKCVEINKDLAKRFFNSKRRLRMYYV